MLVERSLCTGCMACINTCHTNSIRLVEAENSLHQYPEINNDTCINCGLCERVCVPLHPELLKKDVPYTERYFCAWDKDDQSRSLSTSGGVASAMARFAISNGYYVAGAAFDEKWHLEHIVSNDESVVEKLRGSKYLLSDTKSIYREIRVLLVGGGKVLFFGTPCEISALNALVPPALKNNLVTCGIVCHGVNAPIVWKDFVNYLNNKYKSKLKTYNFRSKSKGWGKLQVSFSFENGKRVDQPAYKNLFHVWFGKHYLLRESCMNCIYRTHERYSDLVIGDFWGIDKINPALSDKKGVSVLIIASKKGEEFVSSITNVEMIETDPLQTPNVLKGYLPTNKDSINEVERAKQFALNYHSKSFEEMRTLYPIITFMDRAIASVKYRLKL